MPDPNETGEAAEHQSTDEDPNRTQPNSVGSSEMVLPSNVAAFARGVEALAGSPASSDGDASHAAARGATSAALPTDLIPGYELLAELGRGGMGVVYRARDTRLNREVALKMILRADTNRVAVARFWAEAEVTAAVKHPHVVQVFELGEHDGRPFMAMELVSGGSLSDRIKATGAFSPSAAAVLAEKIARGVAAAHDLSIVHRDLKPGNVLMTADNTPRAVSCVKVGNLGNQFLSIFALNAYPSSHMKQP